MPTMKKPRMGRPPLGDAAMPCIMVRVSPATLDVLKTIAHYNNEPASALARRFIEQGVTRARNSIGDDALRGASEVLKLREQRLKFYVQRKSIRGALGRA